MTIRIPSSELLRTVCKCSDCHLYEFADNPYISGRWYSNNHPDVPLFCCVGEAPGTAENKAGACFQHTSLKNLQKALGDKLNDCYLTNVCRCIPWSDPIQKEDVKGAKVRKPTPLEMECCLPWLLLELSKFPEGTSVVAMGATAFQALLPSMKEARITEIAGQEFDLVVHGKHYRLFAQVHPASISYNPTLSEKFFSVFNSIVSRVTGETVKQQESEYWEILDPSKAIKKLNEAKQLYLDNVIKYVVTDTETSGFSPWENRIIMFGLSHTNDKKGYSIPMEIQNRFDFPDFPTDLYPIDFRISDHDIQLIKAASRDLFDTVPIVGHNIKFDLKMMAYHNYLHLDKVRVYNDTLLLSAVLVGRQWRGDSLGLKEMSQKLLGLEQSWDWVIDEWLKKYKRVADRTFANIPTCILGKYCALDHFYTRQLHEVLYPKIETNLCQELINALNIATVAYSEAELKGIEIDWDVYELVKTKADSLMIDINKRILRDPHIKKMMMEKYEKDLHENSLKKKPKDPGFFYQKLINGDYFSIGSVKDKRDLIYKRYNVPVTNLTDKGEPSTDKESISSIAKNTDNERLKSLCDSLLEYNKFSKIKSTYVDNLPDNCDDNKTYHCEFNIAGTVTGRLCIHGDTVVNTVSGDRKIKDIPEGEVIYVYSYDLENHKMTVSEAVSLGVTRRENRAVKITLDNGREIITTVDHKFLTKDEEYVEAQNLSVGNSLMPFNIKINDSGYYEFYDNEKKWIKTHSEVAYKFLEGGIARSWKRIKKLNKKDKHLVVHHKDANKLNNDPSNLVWLGENEHWVMHSRDGSNRLLPFVQEHQEELAKRSSDRLNERWKNEEFKDMMYNVLRENTRKNWENPDYVRKVRESNNHSAFLDPEIRKIALARSAEVRRGRINELLSVEGRRNISNGGKSWWSKDENKRYSKIKKQNRLISRLKKFGYNCDTFNDYIKSRKDAINKRLIWTNSALCKSEAEFNEALIFNHSVQSIEYIEYDSEVDFYDITVPECHNFAIEGSIIVSNSSGFHTLPRKSSIKYLYTSKNHKESGSIWLSPDMSQLELRVTAGIANEKSWINAYKNGEDLHQRTAANMFNVDFENVSKDQRKIGKIQNFALLYGSGPQSQAEKLGITVEEAEEMLARHKATIPSIVALVSRQEAFATKHGFIWNMFNRYMPIPDAQSTDRAIKSHGLREAFNYLIQSTGSDIVMTSFARMYQDIKNRSMRSLMYGTVHDSIETSASDYELISIINMFKYHFEDENNKNLVWMNGCPLVLSLEFGTSWGSSVEFEPEEYDWNHVKFKTEGLECNVNKLRDQLLKCYDVDMKEIDRKELTDEDFGSEDFIRDSYNIEFEMIISNRDGHKVKREI